MTIVRTSSTIIEREAPSKLNTSYGNAPDFRRRVIVQLFDDSGHVGFGEASPLPFFTGETPGSIDFVLQESYLPLLAGKDPFALNSIHRELDELPANTSAKAAIDIALHDLCGKIAGRPVSDLLGGAVRDHVTVTFPIGITTTEDAVEKATSATSRGITTIKMKIGRDPDSDVERVEAVRRAVGPDVRIRIDANSGYTVPTAVSIIKRLANADLEYVEQPVARWDFEGMAQVRRRSDVPIMADEGVHTLRDAQRLIELGAADIFAIKLIKTSGLHQARAISALAAAHRIDIVVISPFETQIGASAGLALALSAPTGHRAHELRCFDTQPELAETDIYFRDGRIYGSSGPGLGVTSIQELATEPVA